MRTDVALATQIGITAVPTFVLDQKYSVSGAQPVEVLLDALRQVWDLQGTEPEVAQGGGCGGGCCGGGCGSEDTDTVTDDAGCGCGGGGCGGGICGSDESASEDQVSGAVPASR